MTYLIFFSINYQAQLSLYRFFKHIYVDNWLFHFHAYFANSVLFCGNCNCNIKKKKKNIKTVFGWNIVLVKESTELCSREQSLLDIIWWSYLSLYVDHFSAKLLQASIVQILKSFSIPVCT